MQPVIKEQSDRSFFGHPAGLKTLFLTEMWERMSYYGMRALLVLFMTTAMQTGGLGLTVASATAIYGLYTGAVYFMDSILAQFILWAYLAVGSQIA